MRRYAAFHSGDHKIDRADVGLQLRTPAEDEFARYHPEPDYTDLDRCPTRAERPIRAGKHGVQLTLAR